MTELETFDSLLKKTLSISKEELQRRIEREKAAKSSSSRAPGVSQKAVSPTLPVTSA